MKTTARMTTSSTWDWFKEHSMSKLILISMVLGMMYGAHVLAAEWLPIKRGEGTVREIDANSIRRNDQLVEFVVRHTFVDKNEYLVGRREVKYLLITSRANCEFRTLAKLSIAAYDEKMNLISNQQIQESQGSTVTPESIDENMLNYICANVKESGK